MAITDLFLSATVTQMHTQKRPACTSISHPVQRPTQSSALLVLPTDLILPIIAYLPNPRPLLTACRATHQLSADSYTRATWILTNLPKTNVPKGLVAFWIATRHRIMNASVLHVLESMGAKVPSETALPSAEWDGWRMIGMVIAMRGDEEVLRLALDKELIRHWRTFIQAAYGAGNHKLVGTALEHLVDDAAKTSKVQRAEVETDSSFDDSSDSESESIARKPVGKPVTPKPTSQNTFTDPILQHYALHHAISTDSPYLFHRICNLMPPTSQTWSTIAPFLFTNASSQIMQSLASFILSKRAPVTILLMSARNAFLSSEEALDSLSLLIRSGAVNLKTEQDREVGIMLLRSAALDGDVAVLEKLVSMGAVVVDELKESARLGGCKKCIKIVSKSVKG
ncbi:hypothetical protein HK097_001109 [Rhizophlyctis rosea]|uniref:F-box domain-containing protein n=1 Tax=Rhizophlyctis rosea TaxID=64517 RepID=A0AAD5S6I4_9FUNG|nr:hypothetical protein HK097_001109 [Rhizophlyctis rosea]